jgi:hypothetical protein
MKTLFQDVKGVCGDSYELGFTDTATAAYYCSDIFLNQQMKLEWLTFLPCTYITSKCGSEKQVITLSGETSQTINAKAMDLGDVCMYVIKYNGTDTQQKIWFDSMTDVEITFIDGIRTHPWLDYKVVSEGQFLNISMPVGEEHEFGDSWYNLKYPGTAYVFIKARDIAASASFTVGYKPLFPKWAIYAAAVGGGLLLFICLFICCCYVRRQAQKKA